MTLVDLITALEAEDPAKVVRNGFTDPHSYRGYYDELAFEPACNVTVGDMLADAKGALGETYTGYKGGDFAMTAYTDCWLSSYGHASGETIGPTLLRLMLADVVPAAEERIEAITEATVMWRDRPGGDVGLAIALAGILDTEKPEPPASAALVRVLGECDRIEREVRANPTEPDFDGAYLAAIRHIRAAIDPEADDDSGLVDYQGEHGYPPEAPDESAAEEPVASVTAPSDERVLPPPLPGAIQPDSQWCWGPLYPHRRSRVRITDTRWDGETWRVETEALDNSGRALAGRRRWVELDDFIESAVAVDPVSEADYRKWRP